MRPCDLSRPGVRAGGIGPQIPTVDATLTPSRKDNVDAETETALRAYGCDLIQRAGILLRLQAVTIASGQTLLHRFYFRRSFKDFDVRVVTPAALYLACKLEENPRRVHEIIYVFHFLQRRDEIEENRGSDSTENVELFAIDSEPEIIDGKSKEFKTMKMEIERAERYILREMGFLQSTLLLHPHRYILQYIHSLINVESSRQPGGVVSKLAQKAWGYLNDSLRTTLCCEVQPGVIAVGCIYLAACDCDIILPQEARWYEAFDVSWEDIERVCQAVRSLYKRPPPKYIKCFEPKEKRRLQNSAGAAENVDQKQSDNVPVTGDEESGSVVASPSVSSVADRSESQRGARGSDVRNTSSERGPRLPRNLDEARSSHSHRSGRRSAKASGRDPSSDNEKRRRSRSTSRSMRHRPTSQHNN